MKRITFLLYSIVLTTTAFSQWTFETILPYDSIHTPVVWQVSVVDSSTSWVFGTVTLNQNTYYPYLAKRTSTGWKVVQTPGLGPDTKGKCITARDTSKIWLGTHYPEEIYYSSNSGNNWVLQCHISDTAYVRGIMFSKQYPEIGYAFADIGHNGMWSGVRILKTTNSGQNWTKWEFEMYAHSCADGSMSVIDSNFAWFGVWKMFSSFSKIIMTSNGGIDWLITEVDVGVSGPYTVQFGEDKQTGLYTGESGNTSWFYRTTNAGINWTPVYSANYFYPETMRWVQGTSNIYCNSEFQIVRSQDNGATWSAMSGAAPTNLTSLDAVRINSGSIYALAVTWDNKVYKLVDSVRVIGIENIGTYVPMKFALHQNYPNPFNPATTIEFDLPKEANVTIAIYDITGKLVTNLANGEFKKAGSYRIEWDASGTASGVYFYRLIAGDFVSTKKMILLK